MSDQYSLETLLDKYLAGTITEEERIVLQQLLNTAENQQQLATIMDQELRERTYEIPEDKTLLSAIQQNLQQQIGARQPSVRNGSFIMRRLAIAAVLIALAGIGFYLWTTFEKNKTVIILPPTAATQRDIAPGGNKAVLRLADGREILLDNAQTGALATQGNAQVIKLDDGRLSYEAKGQNAAILYNTITTPIGGQYQLTLADGSKVWLNSASSLRFPASFTGGERTVELTGEGYFEVASLRLRSGQKMPFRVKINGKAEVEVLGTHFNINAYDDEEEVRTTLLEGKVKMQSAILKPGQQAILTHDSRLTIDDNADIAAAMAWKNGLFYFESANLQSILRQAARWYNVQFQYKDEIKGGFSGEITRNVNISQLLKILELTGKVHFDIQGNTVMVRQ